MYTGERATSAMARARCAPSASSRVGRVRAWYFGSRWPSASAILTSSSMTTPFSACMQTRVPSSPALRMARKIVPSSESMTPG